MSAPDLSPGQAPALAPELVPELGPLLGRVAVPEGPASGLVPLDDIRLTLVSELFDLAGAALMWTLEQGLGEAFTPRVAAAWGRVWELIADTMLYGLREALAVPAGTH